MDNHARRLSFMAYWSLTSSSGGESENYLEWLENDTMLVRGNGAGNDMTAQLNYFDNSTVKIDSAIQSRLRTGGHDILAFANVYSTWPNDLPPLLKHCAGVAFETYMGPTLSWGNWSLLLASFDTLAHYPNNYNIVEYRGDYQVGANIGGMGNDTARIMMAGYAMFLMGRTSKSFFCPFGVDQGEWGGKRRLWMGAFETDIGSADSAWRKLDSIQGTGSWGTKNVILYRSYGANAVIFRTSYGTADFINDSMAVNLHGLFREIEPWSGDTSLTADSIFYLKPYMGKMLVSAGEVPPMISNILPTSGDEDSLDYITADIIDDRGVNHVNLYLWAPDSVCGVNDSISILDENISPPEVVTSLSRGYTWADPGTHIIVVVAFDDSSNVSRDSGEAIITAAPVSELPKPKKIRQSTARKVHGGINNEEADDLYAGPILHPGR
jgi:hypothetical protein